MKPPNHAGHSSAAFADSRREPASGRSGEVNCKQGVATNGRLKVDSAEALIGAAISGAEIINLPSCLVASDIRQGRLQPLLQSFAAAALPIRAIYPTRRHLMPKVRLFIDCLIEAWQPVPPWEEANN